MWKTWMENGIEIQVEINTDSDELLDERNWLRLFEWIGLVVLGRGRNKELKVNCPNILFANPINSENEGSKYKNVVMKYCIAFPHNLMHIDEDFQGSFFLLLSSCNIV